MTIEVEEWVIILAVVVICATAAILSLTVLPPDNPIEQISEKQIEKLTGVSVDFSS